MMEDKEYPNGNKSVKTCFYNSPNFRKVIWETTNVCDHNCIYCCNKNYRSENKDINEETCLRILNEIIEANIKHVVLGGGEPLLSKHIELIIRTLLDSSIEITIATNGLHINEHMTQLFNPHVKLLISVDGYMPATHDFIRGKEGSFASIISNVHKLQENNISNIEFHTVITSINIMEIRSIINMARKLDIPMSMSTIVPPYKHKSIQDLCILPNDPILRAIYEEFWQEVKFIRIGKGALSRCPAGENILGVKPDGLYTPCPWISNYTDQFNNNQISDFKDFLDFKKSFFSIKNCKECEYDITCSRGCIAAAMSNKDHSDFICPHYNTTKAE